MDIAKKVQKCNAYITIALGEEKYSKESLFEKANELQQIARGGAIIGKDQIFSDGSKLENV